MSNSMTQSTVGRKILMALSGFFLLIFLLQHLVINFLSVVSADLFNEVSEFMGTNPLVQFALQPVLFFGVIFHFVMGITLELKNKSARPVRYAMENASANASWPSRNMAITGMVIFLFLLMHMVQFFVPSISAHYVTHEHLDSYEMVVNQFANPIFVVIYIAAFFFLSLHLMHGFQSAFQSVGFRHNKYTPTIQKLGKIYAIAVPATYAFIAIFHFLNQ